MSRTSTETSDVFKGITLIVRLVNMESAFLSLSVYIIKDIIPFGIGADPITVCNGKSMILSFKIIGHGVTFFVKADGISRPLE